MFDGVSSVFDDGTVHVVDDMVRVPVDVRADFAVCVTGGNSWGIHNPINGTLLCRINGYMLEVIGTHDTGCTLNWSIDDMD